jgi:hypothetical protein
MPYKILEHNPKMKAFKCLRKINGKECGGISYHPRHLADRWCPHCQFYHPEKQGEIVPIGQVWDQTKPNQNMGFMFYD